MFISVLTLITIDLSSIWSWLPSDIPEILNKQKNCQNHLINLNQKFARMSFCNSINFVTVLWVCEGKLNIMSMFSSHVNTNDQLSRLRPVSGVVQMHSAQLKMFIRDFGFQSALGHGQ